MLHAVIVVLVPAFIFLAWWQVDRALSGNELSWAYAFEWPLFAGYAVYMWWRLLHDDGSRPGDGVSDGGGAVTAGGAAGADTRGAAPSPAGAAGDSSGSDGEGAGTSDGAEDELAAYNRYLAELDARGRPKRW